MEGPVTDGAPETDEASSSAEEPSTKVETLPPPEWTGPVAAGRRGSQAPSPLPRRTGRRADEGQIRARLEEASVAGDTTLERDTAIQLARWLAARERDLDLATQLAFRALQIDENDELRRELAAWLESLGEAGLAAAELRKLALRHADDAGAMAAILVRVGVLHARAGDAVGASEAFAEVARLNPEDALACELMGTLASWAPDIVTPEAASAAYVEAAARRGASGGQAAREAALEDLLRALEVDPTYEPAARALAGALAESGKTRAADEIWRRHASAMAQSDLERARLVHERRRVAFVEAGDLVHALGAALDEGLDQHLDGQGAGHFDDLLLRTGLLDLLAERLSVRAERANTPSERARLYQELARLYSGPLASPSRAALAHMDALAAEPGQIEATLALGAHATSSRDMTVLVDGLVRAVLAAGEPDDAEFRAGRLASARLLAQIADEQLREPGVAMWAHEQVLVLMPNDRTARAGVRRASPRIQALHAELVRAKNELASSSEATRLEALHKLAVILRGMPGDADILVEVLAELARHAPEGGRSASGSIPTLEAARVAARRGKREDAASLARERLLDSKASSEVRAEAYLILSAAARSLGAVSEANDATRALLDIGNGPSKVSVEVASAAWLNATLAKDKRTRALAIDALASGCASPLAAVLHACASEELLGAGDAEGARRAAEKACRADPHDARCVVALANAVSRDARVDRSGASAVERAIVVVAPTSAWCEALAQALEELGENGYAVAWTQRLVALVPGDLGKVRFLLDRIVRAKDGARLGDALAWALSQPQPGRELGELIAGALHELADVDADRAVVIARRALDVLGPRHAGLRAAMLHVADRAEDDAFAAALLERWIAAGAPAPERKTLFVMLANRRSRAADVEGEVRALARALREGASPNELAERIVTLTGEALSGDGELAWLEARAELLSARGEHSAATHAWRDVGGAAWDLAGDRARALRAWVRAAKLAPSRGYMTLGFDLARFADGAYALDVLDDLADRETEAARSGLIALEAARVALSLGEPARAFDLARRALAKNKSLGDALEIAERGAAATNRVVEMSPVYDDLARRALGRFGRRAAHYRGARFFEHRAKLDLALKHAAEAFTAVPSEGNTLALLSRTADRAQARGVAVRAIEHVAELARGPQGRAAWLLRAASIAGGGEEGIRQRFDVLLRAVIIAPDHGTLSFLADSVRELLARAPDEREVVQMRLVRASDALAKKLDGPEGARVAIAFAELTLDLFGDAEGALHAVERALQADGDLDEFARLVPKAALLARSDSAPESLRRAYAAAQKPYANVGVPALKMLGAIAGALGDAETRANVLVMAVEKDQDDDRLVYDADEALSTYKDSDLTARFAKRVSDERRVESIRVHAREEASAGRHDAAIAVLERAVTTVGDEARVQVEAELREAYDALGFGPEAERRLLREARDAKLTAPARADKWAEIAVGREGLGDMAGAVDALEHATKLDPEPVGRFSELERVADLAGLADQRVAALRQIVERLGGGAQAAPALKRLARALATQGETNEAEAMWRRIVVVEPDDEESDYALEEIITARGDYAELAKQLARRAERLGRQSGTREALRPVRLRRAAILEQRLDRVPEACEELERLLVEWPDNEAALSYLADLYERTGEPARAIALWQRLAGLARDSGKRAEVILRAARACAAAGDLDNARERVHEVLAVKPQDPDALELRVNIARSLESTRELGDALADLASASAEDALSRSDMLVEAAQAAARAGDIQPALGRAQRAASIAPQRAKTQLFARGLEYRVRGAGAPDEARATIESLGRIKESLDIDDAALQTFLLAEALDVVQGGGAGLRKLSERYAELGAHPLVAVGMAERLVSQWNFATAVPLFDAALKGNLLGLRRRGTVALAAADAAARCERVSEALHFLDEAASDPETRTAALRRIAQLAAAEGDVQRSRKVLLELARTVEGSERARTLAQLGRALFASQAPQDRGEAVQAFIDAIEAAEDAAFAEELGIELQELRKRQSVSPHGLASWPPPELVGDTVAIIGAPEVVSNAESDLPAAEAPEPVKPLPVVSIKDLEKAVEEATGATERAARLLSLATAKLEEGRAEEAEKILVEAFIDGSLEAGDILAGQLELQQGRTAELVRVRRQLVDMVPGDMGRLEALAAAALADHNPIYARAIEHVMRAFDPGAGPLPPPPLSAQTEQPKILELLTRHSHEPAGEAVALVWEGATTTFVRTPASYAITGLERIVPGGSSILARLYEISVRLLDAPRIPLFVRRATGQLSHLVALLQPPSAILSCDTREDSAELRHALGQALSAALSQNALVLGLSESEARSMWSAVCGAFGPPELGRALDGESAKLAETFWQVLPARTQRRLKELLTAGHHTRFELLVERARQSGRRVGLFLTGDFGFAARALVREQASLRPEALSSPGGLAVACAQIPALADLFRLAVRAEYADARWHPETPMSRRLSSGRIRVL